MSVTTDVKKTGSTITGRFTLKNLPTLPTVDADAVKKPLFAYVGVADLAIERAKEIPAELTEVTNKAAKKAQALVAEVPAQVTALPVAVRGNVEKATEKATDVYAKLTVRGERLVKQIRRQPATEAAIAEGKEAVRKAEAAATAARKSVKAGEKAVEGAAAKIG
jgi:DNA polymerase II small subunit/DNA polymerase delta subunit B